MKTQLISSGCYNPYIFNGYTVDRILFFDSVKQEMIFSVNWWGSNNYHKKLYFDFDIKKANKVDLSKKTAFFLKGESNKYEQRIFIYIPANLVPVECLGETMYNQTETEKMYRSEFSISAFCTETKWKLNENKDLIYYEEDAKERILVASDLHRFEKTEHGQKMNTFSEIAKTNGIDISEYTFNKLSNIFNISVK